MIQVLDVGLDARLPILKGHLRCHSYRRLIVPELHHDLTVVLEAASFDHELG